MAMQLTNKEARRLTLMQQGLLKPAMFGHGRAAAQKTIERLHHVQIDTISVVDRAHHHILQSRVPGYRPDWLHQLLSQERTVFEYWYHAAAYLPLADYRFYLPLMQGYAKSRPADKKLRREILARLKDQGDIEAKDFDHPAGRKSDGWWDWKPAKVAMERMFLGGELMVKERQGFRKRYALTESLLPAQVDTRLPATGERGDFYVRRMLQAQGIASERDILYVRALVKSFSGFDIRKPVQQSLDELVKSGEVIRCDVDGSPWYCLRSVLEQLPSRLGRRRIHFLSPFDNLVINRRRLKDLFGFDYQIECYLPAAKRQFGYFCLPILYGDEFIGRMDCKADRKGKVFIVHSIALEPGCETNGGMLAAWRDALRPYAISLGCSAIQMGQVSPVLSVDMA